MLKTCVATAFVLVLIGADAEAACRTDLPPASQRAGYWQYHVVKGQRCWFGPLKKVEAPRSEARVRLGTDAFALVLARIPVLATSDETVIRDDDDEIMPQPDVSFDRRFNAIWNR
jgi:hypothetical protein